MNDVAGGTNVVNTGGKNPLQVSMLLGAAYEAVVRAQTFAAHESVKLVTEIGFEQAGSKKVAKTVQFNVVRQELDANHQVVTRNVEVSVPLLSLITLPTIGLEKAEVDMGLEVVTHQEVRSGKQSQWSDGNEDSWAGGKESQPSGDKRDQLTARVASSHAHSTLKVKSVLRQMDIAGAARLEEILQNSISDLGKPVGEGPGTGPVLPKEFAEPVERRMADACRNLAETLRNAEGSRPEDYGSVMDKLMQAALAPTRQKGNHIDHIRKDCMPQWKKAIEVANAKGYPSDRDVKNALRRFNAAARALWWLLDFNIDGNEEMLLKEDIVTG